MRLVCSLQPRRDGTVVFEFAGQAWLFARDAHGDLTAEVADGAAVAHALATGHFYPAVADDEDEAQRLTAEVADGAQEFAAKQRAPRRRAAKAQPQE